LEARKKMDWLSIALSRSFASGAFTVTFTNGGSVRILQEETAETPERQRVGTNLTGQKSVISEIQRVRRKE
jgi:hypothetical protein